MKTNLRNLIYAVNRYDPNVHGSLHHDFEEYLYGLPESGLWEPYVNEREVLWAKGSAPGSDQCVTGPPCAECGQDLRWFERVEHGVVRATGECDFCDAPPTVTT